MKWLWREFLMPGLLIGALMFVVFVAARLWLCHSFTCPEVLP